MSGRGQGGMMMYDMRVTLYLPEHLAQEIEAYRKARPGLSLSALVRELLERELLKRPEALLEAAGLVERAKLSAREHDVLIRKER
jgi:metal-responsive CopG/Arc/MetJ family transcriptional regulator